MKKQITIIGAGVMGSMFASALKSRFKRLELVLVDKNKEKLLKLKTQNSKLKIYTNNVEAVENAGIVILAVKPQSFLEVANELKGKIFVNCLVVSIMAGIGIEKIQKFLQVKKVVRAMPNLGARVGKSMTVWTVSKEANKKEKEFAKKLFDCIGAELFVKSEKMIDKATAVSGSGPGFFFYLVEEWLKAVQKLGFSTVESEKLLLNTIEASNILLQKEKNPSKLKKQVASKGGTTEAGLKIMEKYKISKMWNETLKKAEKRAINNQVFNAPLC